MFPHNLAHTQIGGSEFRKKNISCGGDEGREEGANGRRERGERAQPLLAVLITISLFYIIPTHIRIHIIFSFYFRNQMPKVDVTQRRR